MTDDLDCDQCRVTWEIYGEEPPCDECEPEIMDENRLAVDVFMMVCDQHIMSSGGPVGINMIPIFKVLDDMGIEKKLPIVSMVKHAYVKVLESKRGG